MEPMDNYLLLLAENKNKNKNNTTMYRECQHLEMEAIQTDSFGTAIGPIFRGFCTKKMSV
jgi:hypothetical protein